MVPPRPPIDTPENRADENLSEQSQQENPDSTVAVDPIGDYEGDWNAWYLHRMGSQIVGFSKLSANRAIDQQLLESGKSEVRYQRQDQLIMRRGALQFLQVTESSSVESEAAVVQSIDSRGLNGPVKTTTSAKRRGNRLVFRLQASGEPTTQEVVWSDAMRGPFGIEQSLRRQMMEPGETRRIEGLTSSIAAIAVFELKCTGQASVSMLDGAYKKLMEVEVTTYIDGKPVDEHVLWLDDLGVVVKALHPAIRLESFKVEQSTALKQFAPPMASAIFSVLGTFRAENSTSDSPAAPTEVVFDVSRLSGQLEENESLMIPSIGGQSVKRLTNSFQVLVSADANPQTNQPESTAVDLAPSNLLDSDHPTLTRLANSVENEGAPTASETIEAIARAAGEQLELKAQEEIRPASQVLRSRTAGGIDQAVLLAALLRVRGIPSRVVFGLAPVPQAADQPSISRTPMKFTGWVVALVDGQWTSVDPVTYQFNPADHLAIAVPDANDSGGETEYALELFQAFQRLGEMAIEIDQVR